MEFPLPLATTSYVIDLDKFNFNSNVSLTIFPNDNRKHALDSIKNISLNLAVAINGSTIPLESIINTKPIAKVDIQLLDDEIIDEDEWENMGLDENIDACLTTMDVFTIEDVFTGDNFLSEGWRSIHTLLSLRTSDETCNKICEEIFSQVCTLSNNWLNSLIEI